MGASSSLRMRIVRAMALGASLLLAACAGEPPPPPQVELAGTAIHELPSTATGRRYQLWVNLPASYAQSDASYPVVFLTDANLWFPVVRNLGGLQSQRGQNIEEYILIGLTHDQDLSSPASRARDYTPTDPRLRADFGSGADPGEYLSDAYGEAATYRDYLETEVFPFVAANYRADMSRKVYLGHSYGGLFGAFVLATRPAMFQTYLLSSPSVWFDRQSILQLAEQSAVPLPAETRVMMVAGGYETIRPEPRYYKTVDIVVDMQAYAALLESRGLAPVTLVMPDEDHFTVFPSLITRGLLWALPGRGPYVGG